MKIKTQSPRIQAQVIPLEGTATRGEITFTYPERHNILDLEAWQTLPQVMADMAQVKDMRLITLRGSGDKSFVAGADITQFDSAFSGEAAGDYEQATSEAFAAIADCPVPTLAAITGYCKFRFYVYFYSNICKTVFCY